MAAPTAEKHHFAIVAIAAQSPVAPAVQISTNALTAKESFILFP